MDDPFVPASGPGEEAGFRLRPWEVPAAGSHPVHSARFVPGDPAEEGDSRSHPWEAPAVDARPAPAVAVRCVRCPSADGLREHPCSQRQTPGRLPAS